MILTTAEINCSYLTADQLRRDEHKPWSNNAAEVGLWKTYSIKTKVLLRRQTYTVKLEGVEEMKKASIYTSQGLDSTWLLINLSKVIKWLRNIPLAANLGQQWKMDSQQTRQTNKRTRKDAFLQILRGNKHCKWDFGCIFQHQEIARFLTETI